MDFWTILLLAVGVFVFFRYFVRVRRKSDGSTSSYQAPTPSTATAAADVPEPMGDVDEYEIVGESRYQRELERLFGPKRERGVHERREAFLHREPQNKHDKNAIRCEIGGLQVGYLSRSDAEDFTAHMKKGGMSSMRVVATVKGGWRDSKGEGHYGVAIEVPAETIS